MTWHQFWEEPIRISYGGLAVLLFCVWVVRMIEHVNAARREEIRRYDETHPFGEVKSRYEMEYKQVRGREKG